MLRPLRKANAETRRVFNKALKTEAHSPLCKLYIYIYIYMYMHMYGESTFSHIINWHTDLGLKGAGVSENSIEI